MCIRSDKILNSNRNPEEMWSKDCFSSTFAVVLSDYMCKKDIKANYIRTFGSGKTEVSQINLEDVFGGNSAKNNLTFNFDSFSERYSRYATGIPDMGLLVKGHKMDSENILDIKTTVIPDSSTSGCTPEMMGPEITLRAPTLINCIMSVYEDLLDKKEEVLSILSPTCKMIDDWSNISTVTEYFNELKNSLEKIECVFQNEQKPVMLQAIWRTKGLNPVLESNALDIFVWSDFALTRLFLDSARRSKNGSITRPMRCTIRTVRTLYELLSGNKPDLNLLFAETSYGINNGKEMMINGKISNNYMKCSRLTKPIILSSEIPNIIPSGTESEIIPERRLDQTMYYSVYAARPDTF